MGATDDASPSSDCLMATSSPRIIYTWGQGCKIVVFGELEAAKYLGWAGQAMVATGNTNRSFDSLTIISNLRIIYTWDQGCQMIICAELELRKWLRLSMNGCTGNAIRSCDYLIATGSIAVVVLLLLFALFLDFFRCAAGRGQSDLHSFSQAAF